MPFLSDLSRPSQEVVDRRKTIRLSWYYYSESDDDPVAHFKVYWKEAHTTGWEDVSVGKVGVAAGNSFYDKPASGKYYEGPFSWKVEAWVVDKRYNQALPDPQYLYPDLPANDPSQEVISGVPFKVAESINMVDGTGWVLSRESNANVANGATGTGTVFQLPTPSDPGEYDVMVYVQNGFQWSAFHANWVTLKQFDTRRWVKKSGIWHAVPGWTKKAGVMVRTRT